MRVVNLRVNASTLAGQGPNLAAPVVGANVAVSAATVTNPNVTVATLNPGLDFAVRSSDNSVTVRLNNNAVTNSPVGADTDFQFFLRFVETTPYTLRNRSVAASAADLRACKRRRGQDKRPSRDSCCLRRAITTRAFRLERLSAAGLGDSGTRIYTRFANIPAGARLYVSTSPLADFTSGVTARLVTTDVNGVGFYAAAAPTAFIRGGTVGVAEIPVSAGQAIAVWEALDPSVEVDRLNFGAFLSWNVPVADATVWAGGCWDRSRPPGRFPPGRVLRY